MKKINVSGTILCIILLLLHKCACQEGFNDEQTPSLPKSYNIGWMATLDNNKLISDITIPGTHDALALHGGILAECQAWSLEDQLKAGIRYFDLRVSGEDLEIKHGITYQHIKFPEVIEKIKTFLLKYKTETVFVRVKPVFWFKSNVAQNVVDLIVNDPISIYSFDSDDPPKIGDLRGKIVYVQKNSFNLGISLSETDGNHDYKVTNVERKKNIITSHLENNKNNCKKDSIVLNYSSGTGIGTFIGTLKGLTPKKVARQINPWLLEYLKNESKNKSKPCFGIIAMDFPSFELIQAVISLNKDKNNN